MSKFSRRPQVEIILGGGDSSMKEMMGKMMNLMSEKMNQNLQKMDYNLVKRIANLPN
ncbi:MAG: hypothetical protein GY820_18070 [Gammaproteobacteria bacterium]|nr:hypothetical protein [Gammaproteobacteria bacterium]